MTAGEQHVLKQVARLADARGSLPLELIEGPHPKLVRLRAPEHGMWIMLAREDGSIFDRWSDAEGLRFIRFTDDEIAEGADALLRRLEAAAAAREGDRE